MLGEAVGESFDFDGFDVWGFDDGLAFAVFLEVLFVAAGDGGDFGDDFFAETEEDVGVGLFEDVAVDVFGVLGDHEEAEFVFAALFDGVTSAVDDCVSFLLHFHPGWMMFNSRPVTRSHILSGP
ncbi:hypothetical protein [Halosimplex salinum]|uniref:hypothetical protein n=1 Tax=Halosimplex salinum TaxID=1710538 RepID=UPI0019D0030B|nr:hypothetical protein [Halosimplex salinum]